MNKTKLNSNQGFTLIEILAALTIIAIVISISAVGLNKARKVAALTNVAGTVQHVQAALQQFVAKPGGLGYPPITSATAATAFPLSGATLSAASGATISAAATLDAVLLTERYLESPINVGLGSAVNVPTGAMLHPLLWNPANNYFYCQPDAAPDFNYTAMPHLICQLSTTNVPGTDGSNFYLDASQTALATNSRVVCLMIPGVQGTDAAALSNKLDNRSTASATAANTLGQVAYLAPNATTGLTTVYVYIANF